MSDTLEEAWGLNVLLAADPNEERSLRSHLVLARPCKFRVCSAPNLTEAILELQRRPFDVLLISLHPFDPDGAGTLLRICGVASRIAVVVVTNQANEETALRAVEAGVQEVLELATLRPEMLARTLRHAVARFNLTLELRRAQQVAASQTFFDSVTGLANRSAFVHRLKETLSMAKRFDEHPAVLVVGLDRLATISASLGPWLTTRVLQETGRRLLWCLRRTDMTAHLGDGRLGVLLPNARDLPSVEAVAERIRLTLAEPMENHSRRPQLTASLGIAYYPYDGETAETLLKQAEAAHAQARARGGNCSHLSHDLVLRLRPENLPAPAQEWHLASGTR